MPQLLHEVFAPKGSGRIFQAGEELASTDVVPWVREIESGQAVSGYVAGLLARSKKMLVSCQECCSHEFCSTCPWDDANLAGNLPLQSLMSQQDQLNGRLFL